MRWWRTTLLVVLVACASVGKRSFEEEDEDLSLLIHIVPHSHIPRHSETEDSLFDSSVSNILTRVLDQLDNDLSRRFVWAETLFFRRWYEGLSQNDKVRVKRAVKDGQLEFVGGGVVEYDEAATTWEAAVDQISLGHDWLEKHFGVRPQIGWQIGNTGHSDSTPSILSMLSFHSLIIDKVHYRVKQQFKTEKHLEFVWRGSDLTQGVTGKPSDAWQNGDIFTHILSQGYSAPEGFDFESGKGVRQVTNAKRRADRLVHSMRERASSYRTHHLLVPFGDDLRFMEADKQFTNMEKLMRYINDNMQDVKIRFSTASEYIMAVRETAAVTSLEFPRYLGDFFPYADSKDGYYSGVYSTRQALKAACRDVEDLVRSSDLFFSLARAHADALGDAPPIRSIMNGHVEADTSSPAPAWGTELYENLDKARWLSAQVNNIHGITGAAKVMVVNDLISKLQTAQSAATLVLQHALSQLLTLRVSEFKASGPRVRPLLSSLPFNLADELVADDAQLSPGTIQHPIIVYNTDGVERQKAVHVFLGDDWGLLKHIQVIDAKGRPVRAQLYHQLSLATVKSAGGKQRRKKADGESPGWTSKVFLSFVAKVPPLGFTTYFCFTTSARERIKQSHLANAATPTTQLLSFVKKEGTGRVRGGKQGQGESGDNDKNDSYDEQKDPSSIMQQQQMQQQKTKKQGKMRGSKSDSEATAAEDSQSKSGVEEVESSERFIELENDFIQVHVNTKTGMLHSLTDKRTKRKTLVKQQFMNYPGVKSGTYLFQPGNPEVVDMGEKSTLVALTRGPVFDQVQVLGRSGVGQTIRVWKSTDPGSTKLPDIDQDVVVDDIQSHVEVNYVIAPEVGKDTVVRFETNMDTEGVFYTDNALGQLVKRTSHRDAPLASSVFPAVSTVALRDSQATEVTRMGQVLAVVSKTPFGCSSPFAETGSGVVEIMLHRNHETDDGRGIGEGLADFSTTQFSSLLAVDTPTGMLGRIPHLVSRVRKQGILFFAEEHEDYLQVLSKDNWASRFHTERSLLAQPLASHLWLGGISTRDASSDDVLVRFHKPFYGGQSASSTVVSLGSLFDLSHRVISSQAVSPSGGLVFSATKYGAPFRSSGTASSHTSFTYIAHPLGFSGTNGRDNNPRSEVNAIQLSLGSIKASVVTLSVLQDAELPVSLYSEKDGKLQSDTTAGMPSGGGKKQQPSSGGGNGGKRTDGKTGDIAGDTASQSSTLEKQSNNNQREQGGLANAEKGRAPSGKSKDELHEEAEDLKSEIEVLQRRVDKHKGHIDQLLAEIDKFDKQGKKHLKDATVEDLKGAEVDLEMSKSKLEQVKQRLAQVVHELQLVDSSFQPDSFVFQEEVRIREFEATVHGAVAGAAAMLLFVIAGNWVFSGGLKLARGYVPISVSCGNQPVLPTHKSN